MVVCTLLLFQFLHSTAVQFIPSLKVHFITPPQTRNGHTKKGTATGFLIQLLGGTTAKWLQIGAALTFLSNTPSLLTVPFIYPCSCTVHDTKCTILFAKNTPDSFSECIVGQVICLHFFWSSLVSGNSIICCFFCVFFFATGQANLHLFISFSSYMHRPSYYLKGGSRSHID